MKNRQASNGALINYTYDLVGNVTQVNSTCPWLQNQSFTETFSYDSTDQLVSANEAQSYRLAVNYGNWGKIMQYDLAQTEMLNNTTAQISRSLTYPSHANNVGNSQTLFAPQQRTITDISNNVATETLTFGINGSLRRRDLQSLSPYTEYYLFNSASNLKAYSNNGLDFAYYGYNASNTRSYKLSMLNQNQWVNGQSQPLDLHIQHAMFYPNAYLNFNQNGDYTKHYYNGSERIASRLGHTATSVTTTANARLSSRSNQLSSRFQEDMQELLAEATSISSPVVMTVNSLNTTATATDIFYYHTNHLGSTAYVTDQNQNVTQGFLYAPFGEITTEYNSTFGNDIIPKYSFNAKELDEETGMYYYEARYYKPPVFTSRDAMFEKKPWLSPYQYCSNNPVGRVDPSGMMDDWYLKADGTPTYDKNVNENTKLGKDERYIGKTANWFGMTENDMQYLYHGDENGNTTSRDMTCTVYPKNGFDLTSLETIGLNSYKEGSDEWNKLGESHNGKKAQNQVCYETTKFLKRHGYNIKTSQLKNCINKMTKYSKAAGIVSMAIDGYNIYDTYKSEGGFGINTSRALGSAIGSSAGFETGAIFGAWVGAHFCGIGAIPGAIIGGIVFSIGGNNLGREAGDIIYNNIIR